LTLIELVAVAIHNCRLRFGRNRVVIIHPSDVRIDKADKIHGLAERL